MGRTLRERAYVRRVGWLVAWGAATVAVGPIAGCGDDDATPPGIDAGTGVDAGASMDAGPRSDASAAPDAGSDAGASGLDAGSTPADAASTPDAGAAADAGFAAFDAARLPGDIEGRLVAVGGASIPTDVKVMVLWSVSSGSPDYTYKLGEGTVTGTTFTVTLPVPPDAAAVNDYGMGLTLGVGYVLVVPSTYSLADGMLTRAQAGAALAAAYGYTKRSAVIWRTGTFPAAFSWPGSFVDGAYGCGACVDSASGFDSFTPVPCSSLEVLIGDLTTTPGCNWT